MNQRWLAPRSRRLRDENARRNELARQAELRAVHPDWPAERVRAEARGRTWTEPGAASKRKRDRRNKYGRRGGGNRCGHDRRRFIRPNIPRGLPPFVYWAIEAFHQAERQRRLPFHINLRFGSRSELHEVIGAMTPVLLAWTMAVTTQIARPSKRRPGRVEGYTIDHHIAPATGIGESRIERGVAAYKDWGWHYFTVGKDGRRLASQPVELNDQGEYEGQAAIRRWTPKFWQDIGVSENELLRAQKDHANFVADRAQRSAAARRDLVPTRALVEQLVAGTLSAPASSKPRPPP